MIYNLFLINRLFCCIVIILYCYIIIRNLLKNIFDIFNIINYLIIRYKCKRLLYYYEENKLYRNLLLTIFRDHQNKIFGFVFSPIFKYSNVYNIHIVNKILQDKSTLIFFSTEKQIYTRKIVEYIREYADKHNDKLNIYLHDTQGIDASFILDLTNYNNTFIRVRSAPLLGECLFATMACKFCNLRIIEFKNLNHFIDKSLTLLFEESKISFNIYYDEILEYMQYGITKGKEQYFFYHHIVISLYSSSHIINKKF